MTSSSSDLEAPSSSETFWPLDPSVHLHWPEVSVGDTVWVCLKLTSWFGCSSHAKAAHCGWQQGSAGKQAVGQSKPSAMALTENYLASFQSSLIHPTKLCGWPLGNGGDPCRLLVVTCPVNTPSLMNHVFSMHILFNGKLWFCDP